MLEALSYRGRRVAGFGAAAVLGLAAAPVQVDSTSVLSALGADPKTVYDAYQAQQGFQQMGVLYGKMQAIASTRDDCMKGCGADQGCMNNCGKAAVLAFEGFATATFSAIDPVVGLALGAVFTVLNSVFGFASGVPDPSCPNGPNPWPPSAQDQTTLTNATASIFAGTTAPGGLAPQGVTDPFLLAVMLFRAQQSALIENCHWDQALSGSGSVAAEALMLAHWNAMHAGPSETITRTVAGGQQPPDYDQWSQFVSELATTLGAKPGDTASITINRGPALSLGGNVVRLEGGAAAPTSTGTKILVGGAVVAGGTAASVLGYALYKGISFVEAWHRLTRKVTGK